MNQRQTGEVRMVPLDQIEVIAVVGQDSSLAMLFRMTARRCSRRGSKTMSVNVR